MKIAHPSDREMSDMASQWFIRMFSKKPSECRGAFRAIARGDVVIAERKIEDGEKRMAHLSGRLAAYLDAYGRVEDRL